MSENATCEQQDNTKKREPISLAVAADVTQSPIPDKLQDHARVGAVGYRLQSLLPHHPSPKRHISSLKNELNHPAAAIPATRGSSTSTKSNGGEAQRLDDENNTAESSPPQPPNNKFIFTRMFHAILHPPSIPHVQVNRNINQGHNPNANYLNDAGDMKCSSASSATNHACSTNCVPNCSRRQSQKQVEDTTAQSQAEQTIDNSGPTNQTSSHRPASLSATFVASALSFASNFQNHIHSNTQTKQREHKRPGPFFPFPFHSQTTQSTNKIDIPRYSGPLLYNTSNHEQHDAVVTTVLHVFRLYHQGYDVNEYSLRESNVGSSSAAGDESEGDLTESNGLNENGGRKGVLHAVDVRARHALSAVGFEFRCVACQSCSEEGDGNCKHEIEGVSHTRCLDCVTRLCHVPSNTAVTKDNRKMFIADGKMYDAIADLCQFSAQEIMAETCDLCWVTICGGKGGGLGAQTLGDRKSVV